MPEVSGGQRVPGPLERRVLTKLNNGRYLVRQPKKWLDICLRTFSRVQTTHRMLMVGSSIQICHILAQPLVNIFCPASEISHNKGTSEKLCMWKILVRKILVEESAISRCPELRISDVSAEDSVVLGDLTELHEPGFRLFPGLRCF